MCVDMAQENIISTIINTTVAAVLVLLLTACSEQQDESATETRIKIKYLPQDPARYTRGLNLFQSHCAACHGRQAQGAPGWPAKDASGQFRPPPLNDSGITWHHPMHNLVDIITDGTLKFGGGMPAWKEQLSRKDIDDVLFWIQSQWSREKYESWYRLNYEVEQSRKEFEKTRK